MPRIPPIKPATASGETAAQLATARRMFGATLNLVTTAANAPAALGAMLGMSANMGKASLGPRIGDEAPARARQAGITDTEIIEIVGHVVLNVFTNYRNNVSGTVIDFPVVALDSAA
jgi:hypothetical protein